MRNWKDPVPGELISYVQTHMILREMDSIVLAFVDTPQQDVLLFLLMG
jgi:hypothetical protein